MAHEEDESMHGDRPWVYFMIDAFMLITEFFMLTFKIKVDEVILPQKLPPGGTVQGKPNLAEKKEMLSIHVKHAAGGTAGYEFMTRECTLQELTATMASAVGAGKTVQVRVSYERDVPWGDVMSVFNECNKLKIEECGLVPLRGEAGLR